MVLPEVVMKIVFGYSRAGGLRGLLIFEAVAERESKPFAPYARKPSTISAGVFVS